MWRVSNCLPLIYFLVFVPLYLTQSSQESQTVYVGDTQSVEKSLIYDNNYQINEDPRNTTPLDGKFITDDTNKNKKIENKIPIPSDLVLGKSVVGAVGGGLDLRPPYFNLAEGRKVEASATCGVGVPLELYCKLIGATSTEQWKRPHLNIIRGQICDYCQADDHPASYAVDGTERWWQSPPLSRGHQYNEVNFTIDLGQEFHVAYVFIKMANSPRPAVWVLERSKDQGKTWQPWQYFADTDANCEIYFGRGVKRLIRADDDVICTTEFSHLVPLEDGEIVISLINHRPNAHNFSYATELQEFTRATNVRIRLLRAKTLLGHLMALTRQDSTVTRRYFYSIKDISIGGRCVCNGHADTCDKTDLENPSKLVCRCQHDTCGPQCEYCCPGFRQKPWKPSTFDSVNPCEPCNCFGHSSDCDYDAEIDRKGLSLDIFGRRSGGGVCKNCQHNTQGINCNECRPGFYRPVGRAWNATDACIPCVCDSYYSNGHCAEETGICECKQNFTGPNCGMCNKGYYDFPTCKPCECFGNGTEGEICEYQDGFCPCKFNFQGRNCDQCALGYYGFPACQRCECEMSNVIDYVCNTQNGQCKCKPNYGSKNCNECANGYYQYPGCLYCSCDPTGTLPQICDKETSQCLCKPGYTGQRCDRCDRGYYGYPDCKKCNCSELGSFGFECQNNGQCQCKTNFTARQCDQCAAGYYEFPECKDCECDVYGSKGRNCDDNGQCWCKDNFDGNKCTSCKEGFYNFPICEECNCDPAGIIYNFLGCGAMRDGLLCQCKERVTGHICDKCKPLYWNLKISNPFGCEDCGCDARGVVSGFKDCESENGQCICKANVEGRACDQCKDGYFNLQTGNLFGCTSCDCNPGGSVSNVCDKETGQCPCLPRIEGRTCDRSIGNHYVPLLNHLRFELEDGLNAETNAPVRYAYDENVFPRYSWRGYAIFSELQPKVIMDVSNIPHGLYRLVARYVNRNAKPVLMEVSVKNRPTYEHSHSGQTLPMNPSSSGISDTSSSSNIIQSHWLILKPDQAFITHQSKRPQNVTIFASLPQYSYATTLSTSPTNRELFLNRQEEGDNQMSKIATSFVIDSNYVDVVFELKDITDSVFIDYFNLIPSEYYEATKLQYHVEDACKVGDQLTGLCRQYVYPPLEPDLYPGFVNIFGDQSYMLEKDGYYRQVPQHLGDFALIQNLNLTNDMIVLDTKQKEVNFDMKLEPSEDYNFIVHYYTPHEIYPYQIDTTLRHKETNAKYEGHLTINQCDDKLLCRQFLTTRDGKVLTVPFKASGISGDDFSGKPKHLAETKFIDSANGLSNVVDLANIEITFRLNTYEQQSFEAALNNNNNNNNNNGANNDPRMSAYNPSLAIASVSALPARHWNIDLVKPTLLSINNNEHKIISHFDQLGTYRYRLDDDNNKNATKHIVHQTFNQHNYSRVDPKVNHTIQIKLPNEGEYVVIAKYVQDKYPGFTVNIDIDEGKGHIIGKFKLDYCPNLSGCYVLLKDSDLKWVFELPKEFNLTIYHHTPYLFWLNNIILMPKDVYQNNWLVNTQPIDQTVKFIERCTNIFIENDTNTLMDPFCQKAMFSLSTDFNTGALQCDCDNRGSISYSCNPVGGQCQCKANIIGRTCSRCKSGYYGFPNCQRCSCPFSLCDESTGQCLCPPRVTGAKCETCEPFTFGYDPIIGCQPCNCMAAGVANPNTDLNCQALTGKCRCKPNVVGRDCSTCQFGHYGFPQCQQCACDARGVTQSVCDSYDGSCYCKENTEAPYCDRCKPGTFLLDGRDPKGCINCFCFGATQICQSSMMFWHSITRVDGWTLKDHSAEVSKDSVTFDSQQKVIYVKNLGHHSKSGNGIYLSAPQTYIGNKVKSYGGNLSYELFIRAHSNYKEAVHVRPTLILKGNNMTLIHYSDEQPNINTPHKIVINLREFSFEHLDNIKTTGTSSQNGIPMAPMYKSVTREQFMMILANVQELSILVQYFSTNLETHVRQPSLDTAANFMASSPQETAKDNTNPLMKPALSVEQCQCPINYAGTSCETCNVGYYRVSHSNPWNGINNNANHFSQYALSQGLGDNYMMLSNTLLPIYDRIHAAPFCVKCECNGHAETCEDETGKCIDCQHNTTGDHCEMCQAGFYGDSRLGTPNDCSVCPCPLPQPSNNFANSCQIRDDGQRYTLITCDCHPNYAGLNCERCAPGFYGEPYKVGGSCQPCQCNNNLDMSHESPCDGITGTCIACGNNTAGPSCNLCALGYFGNAISGRCQPCKCNGCGSTCDALTGHCRCHANVAGQYCDVCAPGFWDFKSCSGCKACNCSIGAETPQCDTLTGQCACKPGTTGKYCEKCRDGFWNYGPNGCQPCACASHGSIGTHCDAKTGQCSCLLGVTGDKCDQCKPRHILAQGKGCQPCDKCIHTLLDDVDTQQNLWQNVSHVIRDISSGVYSRRRFNEIHQTIANLAPLLESVRKSAKDPNGGVRFEMAPIKDALLALGVQSQYIETKLNNLVFEANVSHSDMTNLTKDVGDMAKTITNLHRTIYDVITKARRVENAIKSDKVRENRDTLVEQAQRMSTLLNDMNFNLTEAQIRTDMEAIYELLYRGQFMEFGPKQVQETMTSLVKDCDALVDKLRNVRNFTRQIYSYLDQNQRMLQQTDPLAVKQMISDTQSHKTELGDTVRGARRLIEETKGVYINASKNMQQLEITLESTNTPHQALLNFVTTKNPDTSKNENQLPLPTTLIDSVLQHSQMLESQSYHFQLTFNPTKAVSSPATKAALVYKTITESILNGSWLANSAEMNIQAAESLINIDDNGLNVGLGDQNSRFFHNNATNNSILGNKNHDTISRTFFIASREILAKTQEASSKIQFDSVPKLRLIKETIEINEERLEELGNEVDILQESVEHALNTLTASTGTSDGDILQEATRVLTDATNLEFEFSNLAQLLNQTSDKLKSTPSYMTNKGKQDIGLVVTQALSDVKSAESALGSAETRVESLKHHDTTLDGGLDELEQLLAQARTQTEQISLGINSDGEGYLTLHHPEHLIEATSHTSLHGYFRTSDKNGLIFFAGPSNHTNHTEAIQDFFALAIQNGYPHFYFDMGEGAGVVKSNNFVADNQWHKFIIERNGIRGILTIISRTNESTLVTRRKGKTKYVTDTQEAIARGSKSIMNFGGNGTTVIYIAGLPKSSKKHISSAILESNNITVAGFKGCIDGLVLNRQPISLWNFKETTPGITACHERDWEFEDLNGERFDEGRFAKSVSATFDGNLNSDKMDMNEVASTLDQSTATDDLKGQLAKPLRYTSQNYYHFDGSSFTIVPKGKFNPTEKSHIGFKIKTLQPKALLIFARRDSVRNDSKDYMALEINDGQIIFHFNLGSGPAYLVSDIRIDDNNWHDIDANRQGQNALLRVDGREVANTVSPGTDKTLEIGETIFVGGLDHEIALQTGLTHVPNFKGCLEDLQFGRNFIDLGRLSSNNPGMSLGCPQINTALLSFPPFSKGYISMDIGPITYDITINLRFKTVSESSLLMFAANADRSDVFALIILSGNVVLISKNAQDSFSLSTYDKNFNDGMWHNLNAVKDDTGLYLSLDDSYKYQIPAPQQILNTTSPLFIGGISPQYTDSTENFTGATDSSLYFTGCLSDIFINNILIDFTNVKPANRPNVMIGECYHRSTNISSSAIVNINDIDNLWTTPAFSNNLFDSSTTATTPITDSLPKTVNNPSFDGDCVLPIEPMLLAPIGKDEEQGFYFDGVDSRLEYDDIPKHRISHAFSLQFKTGTEKDGIMFFVTDSRIYQYIYLALESGYLVYGFKVGDQPCFIRVPVVQMDAFTNKISVRYNDNNWHTLMFNRDARIGELYLDGESVGRCKSVSEEGSLNVIPPYYVGGVPRNLARKLGKINLVKTGFKGCMKNFTLNSIPFGKRFSQVNVHKCPAPAETGFFFSGNNSYFQQELLVSEDLSIKFWMKPRVKNGTIMTLTNTNGNYLNIQIVNGNLVFSFNSGDGTGPVVVNFSAPKNLLCDGHWHSVEVVKAQNFGTLSIDDIFGDLDGVEGFFSQFTGALYIGGIPVKYIGNSGLMHNQPYIGCFKHLAINHVDMDISIADKSVNVQMECPLN